MTIAPVLIDHVGPIIRPDPSRVIIRPFNLEYPAQFADGTVSRSQKIGARIFGLEPDRLKREAIQVIAALKERHRNAEDILVQRFEQVRSNFAERSDINYEQKLLIGAYFSEEYSFESAASFNPSMLLHPDQSNLEAGAIRFVMSLRSIGEGHVSSITFRTGTWKPGEAVNLDMASRQAVPPSVEWMKDTDDGSVILHCDACLNISEIVLFPVMARQHQGIEDLRMVKFIDENANISYFGTYTAFNGIEARSELLCISDDFKTFEMRPLSGMASLSKGMALFPQKIDGCYAMLGRQDNENIWFIKSDTLYEWHGGTRILMPQWPWEFVQLGNCGSPIEIEEGWLVITHGVGSVRNYCMGACLLDKHNPTRVLARTAEPFLKYNPLERDGYVPNVVYSCGAVVHNRILMLPYGAADYFTAFASVSIEVLLAAME